MNLITKFSIYRFGLYTLETVFEGYPAYNRKASGQTFFYKEEYEKWQYAHKFERWLIGPTIGDESVSAVLVLESVQKKKWNYGFRLLVSFRLGINLVSVYEPITDTQRYQPTYQLSDAR